MAELHSHTSSAERQTTDSNEAAPEGFTSLIHCFVHLLSGSCDHHNDLHAMPLRNIQIRREYLNKLLLKQNCKTPEIRQELVTVTL